MALRFILGEDRPRTWRLWVDGRWAEVPVRGSLNANDGEVIRRWARQGLGIACTSWLDVAADIEHGSLVQLNPTWEGELGPLHLAVSGRRQMPASMPR